MKALNTPKFTGEHRRCGRFGEISTFQSALAIVVVLVALTVLIAILFRIRG